MPCSQNLCTHLVCHCCLQQSSPARQISKTYFQNYMVIFFSDQQIIFIHYMPCQMALMTILLHLVWSLVFFINSNALLSPCHLLSQLRYFFFSFGFHLLLFPLNFFLQKNSLSFKSYFTNKLYLNHTFILHSCSLDHSSSSSSITFYFYSTRT